MKSYREPREEAQSQNEIFEQFQDHLKLKLGRTQVISKKSARSEWTRVFERAQKFWELRHQEELASRPPEPRASHAEQLEALRAILGPCERCKLSTTRKNIVYGEGNPQASLVFVGEGPGETEDLQGRPFVGRAGQLLTKMIEAMGLSREDVYIANVVKCRPPENRTPEPDEVSSCQPFLFRQIEIIAPKVVVLLGATALKCIYGPDLKMSQSRGHWMEFPGMTTESHQGPKVMPTFHPAYLLRNPPAKKEVWEDLQLVMKELGLARKQPLT